MRMTEDTLSARFWSKVRKLGDDDCWVWTGSRSKDGSGYGQIFVRGKIRGAHRVSYELGVGPIGASSFVCHRCDNMSCVNPKHLFLGSLSDNMTDMVSKGRCYNRKLSDDDVRQIRARAGESSSAIAAEFGLNPATVRKIRARKHARHVL